jgi:TonB family protein
MARGKSICSVLKTIRKQVADANEIKYEPRECHYEGECRGTCPACEAEVRYIERELDIRRQLGKAVAIVGISAGLSALSGCGDRANKTDCVSEEESRLTVGKVKINTPQRLDGDVEYKSPVDTVIVEKDPATIKKRTAPFKAPAPKEEKKDPVVLDEDDEVMGRTGGVEPELGAPPLPIIPQDEDPSKVFGVVEQMPSFPGGDRKLMDYLKEHTRYPEESAEACVQGRVICTFIVEKDGSISNVKVAKSLDPLLDAEAVRVVSGMPKWIPGKQNGVTYRVKYTIPVTFRLQ